MSRSLRGLEEQQEQKTQKLLRDTRTIGQRFADILRNPLYASAILAIMAMMSIFFSPIADLLFVLGLLLFITSVLRKAKLPFRMPQRAKLLDYNDLAPNNKPRKARGIYFFGNDLKTDQELWFTNDDMRTHVLIFGSTGSGKTEALVSIAYNALMQGSGFIYVDGKGDNSLFAKIFAMVRSMGREDDLLLINFMTGAKDIIGPQKLRLSNTMNPFAIGSSSMLTQLVVSLMDSGAQGGDGDMWKGRAINFVEALMKILVAMRDAGHILLDANSIRDYFALEKIEAMVSDKVFMRENQDPINIENVPTIVTDPIKNYLINLPGYNREKKGKQVSQVLEQHGYITMQLTRTFGTLADTYSHVLRTNLAEVDFKDVVLNRRILVVLLPALEKSPDELAILGKVVIASLKAMMAAGLGDAVEGEYRDVIQRKPTNAPTPYLCILDEYGYYAVKGFAVVPAQARSLGFSVVFAGQDLPAFQKASKEEALSIGANTNIKICMKLEDPLDTWDFFNKTAGETYTTQVKEFNVDAKGLSGTYQDSKNAGVEKRSRIDLLDLKDQREGEAHIFFKSKLVRARMFFANPPPVKKMHLNQFIKVETMPDQTMYEISKVLQGYEQVKANNDAFADVVIPDDDLERALLKISQTQDGTSSIEKGVAVLLAYREVGTEEEAEEVTLEEFTTLPEDQLNLFTPIRLSQDLQDSILAADFASFTAPFADPIEVRSNLIHLGRLLGVGNRRASTIGMDIVRDMQMATHYPPYFSGTPTPEELADLVVNLTGVISLRKAEVQAQGTETQGGTTGT